MRITVAHTPEHYQEKTVAQHRSLSELTAVVVDVLRASTTMVTALMNGAKRIVPCQTIEEATRYVKEHCDKETSIALSGERHAFKVESFDLGNSPQEYTADAVNGKTIVMTTTNGTRALQTAPQTEHLMIGCLLNANRVAKACGSIGKDVELICAGTDGEYSEDDVIGAGGIINQLVQNYTDIKLESDGKNALELFLRDEKDLTRALKQTAHGQRLKRLGFEEDIAYCAQHSLPEAPVPILQAGEPQYLTTLPLSE